MTVRGNSSSAAAARPSTATVRASPRCSSPGARTRRSSSSTSRRRAARSNSRRSRSTSATRSCSTNVIGAYPIDIDGDGHMDLFVLQGRRQPAAQGRAGLHLHAGEQGMEFRRRFRLDDLVRRRVGAGPEIPDAGDRPLRRPRRAGLALGHLRGELALSPAARRQARLFGAHAARAGLLRALDAVHRLEQVRRRRRSGSRTTASIIAAARSRCGASSPARRRAPIPAPTAGGICRSSAWASPRATSTARATPNISSPRWATRSCRSSIRTRPAGASLPVYRDIAGEVGATAHIPYTGGDKRPSTAWHAEFADFNNDGLLDIFVSKGNLSQMPDFAAYDPSNLLIGQWSGKFAEAGDLAGHLGQAHRPRRDHRRLQSRRHARHPADRPRLERRAVPQPRRQMRRRLDHADGQLDRDPPRRAQSEPQRGRGAGFPSRRACAPRPARSRSAAATRPATPAGSMSASARPSGRRSGCNGRTATGARPIGCSPTSSSSSTAQSRRRITGIRAGSSFADCVESGRSASFCRDLERPPSAAPGQRLRVSGSAPVARGLWQMRP